ncbi:HD domain-containing protein [Ornithinibacillus gellani]|uniref:HD domain-containing protein n=1 Tax=Ornithinibacillus gellani TaxID=2293253 RepID=UPI000F45FC95|nr:HD domain-containing protein [Ornithinibacillus gellani]TQS74370.1 HD domain-containing protein [Ornithinibacillus gellani]
MNQEKQLACIEDYVYQLFQDDASGHDFFHMKRVAHTAGKLAETEGADRFICTAAAWLHDVGDKKLFQDPLQAIQSMKDFLVSIQMPRSTIQEIEHIIANVSFSKGNIPHSIEGKIVQDADRMDAIGAIGIARTFAYGGAKGNLIHHPTNPSASIQHFYDKLLKLKDQLNTAAAKTMASSRHQFMETFLEQFLQEWEGNT